MRGEGGGVFVRGGGKAIVFLHTIPPLDYTRIQYTGKFTLTKGYFLIVPPGIVHSSVFLNIVNNYLMVLKKYCNEEMFKLRNV